MDSLSSNPRQIENHEASDDLDFYRLFAYCFGLPSKARFAWLTSREYRAVLKSLSLSLGSAISKRGPSRFPHYSDYEAAYLAVFEVGVPAPPVPLLDSAYSRSEPAQQIVLDCVNFYSVLELRSLDAVFPADHLVTQLEFLAAVRYLRAASSNPEQQIQLLRLERDFIDRHLLTWLPIAEKKLEKINPPIFLELLRVLISHLRTELTSLRAPEPS